MPLYLFLGLIFLSFSTVFLGANSESEIPQNENMDREKYESGKAQYEVVSQYSKMPNYGKCWMNALEGIQKGCKELTDVVQSRLALFYLNCFLELQGRPQYSCMDHETVAYCTKTMAESDRSSYTTFFTHTQNICYFLQSQAWHMETQRTISRLAENSAQVATQLEESSQLQERMLHQQNTSLENQIVLIHQATNLSQIIANSSSDARFMFDEFNRTTQEQRLMIFDIFDRVAKLQSLVLGEFTGFYSVMFYTLSILISYMLTSTPRTSGARFWLFGIMTLNIVAERVILSWGCHTSTAPSSTTTETANIDDSVLYVRQWWCRQISCVLGLGVLAVCAYRYQDLNVVNNKLLVEIRKQNSDLQRFILSGSTPMKNGHVVAESADGDGQRELTQGEDVPLALPAEHGNNTTGYESDDSNYSSASSSDSQASDHTFVLNNNNDDSDADLETSSVEENYSTAASSRASTPALLDELQELRNSTPMRELRCRSGIRSPLLGPGGDGLLKRSGRSRSRSTTPLRDARPGLQHYFLRDRSAHPSFQNPMVATESPETFSRTIKKLAKVASRNSMFARFTIERQNLPLHSSDED